MSLAPSTGGLHRDHAKFSADARPHSASLWPATLKTEPAVSKKQKSVLLALTDTHHGFYIGAARYAREHGWHLVTDMIYTASLPHGWQGDGILSFIGNRNDLAEFILANPAPAVEISLVRADIDLPRVEADNHLIGRLAAGHFVERGFRHFLWVPFQNDVPNRERRDGFHQGLSEAGASMWELPTRHWEIGPNGSQDWAARRRIVSEELARLPKPLAVFCYNDCVAADIIAACDQAGIVVPDQVAVLGVDNDAMLCESINTPLSSVRHDLEGLAYEAAALLDHLMDGGQPPAELKRVPPKGIAARRSTDILAVGDLKVARALRFIWDQFATSALSVDDVAAAVGVNRRVLEKAFRRELGRGVNQELASTRLRAVAQRLTSSEDSVTDIAVKTGYTRPNHLFRTFREHFGMSPRQYREQARLAATEEHAGGVRNLD
jgi:LacI family transcriptional regulator